MPLKVKVRYPRPDIKGTEAEVHRVMTKFTLDTLKTWVLATTEPVPVWSGAARATFLQLAAQAFTSITINPVVESRLTLGITETDAEVIIRKNETYGWRWETDLVHMPIVEERVGFIATGLKAIKNAKVELPQPKTKPTTGI